MKPWSSGLWRRVLLWYETNVSGAHAAYMVSYHNTTWRHMAKNPNLIKYLLTMKRRKNEKDILYIYL
jgi:hypothetical protein